MFKHKYKSIKKFTLLCLNCGKVFRTKIDLRETNNIYKYFCSEECVKQYKRWKIIKYNLWLMRLIKEKGEGVKKNV